MSLGILLKLTLVLLSWSSMATSLDIFYVTREGCQAKCGNITIPYPFGIGVNCAQSIGHSITCNSTYTPAKPFILDDDHEVLRISPTEVHITNTVAFRCYNQSSEKETYSSNKKWTNLEQTPYTFSEERNRFISIGCNIIGFIQDYKTKNDTLGCISMCTTKESLENNSCYGNGCCRNHIPKGLKHFRPHIKPYEHSDTFNYSRCSYSFLADYDHYNFTVSDISSFSFLNKTQNVHVVLDWVIDNKTCNDATRNLSSFSCQKNSECVDYVNGVGYRCRCKNGYEGNPYLPAGCQDIDECKDLDKNQCIGSSNCVNSQGSYNCICPPGTYGDGKRNSRGCILERKVFPFLAVTLGVGLGLLFLLLAACWLYFVLKRRRMAKLRAKFFEQNGGLLLQKHLSSQGEGGAVKLTRLYTAEELKEATDNYDDSRILGRGVMEKTF